MRSKVNVPVGQGCKKVKAAPMFNKHYTSGKCLCHPELYLNRCMGCGDLFHSPAPHTKTCGDRCRKRLSRLRHAEFFQTVLAFANGQ